MTLQITEIFYSLQGEGSAAGYPFIFIRLAKCNLRCSYCDTGYSFENGQELSIEQILKDVKQFHEVDKILITGGEPLLQKEGLLVLIKELHSAGKKIYIETNGSLDISILPDYVIKIVDIKTPSSGFGDSFLPQNIQYLLPHDDLKIVIGSREDFDFAVYQINQYQIHQKCTVLFSPVAGKLSPEKLARWILESKLPVKLNLQIHKILDLK